MFVEMRRIALIGIAAALVLAVVGMVAVIGMWWVVPYVRGPTVDCGPLDQATCDRVAPPIIAGELEHARMPPDVPYSLVIGPSGVSDSGCVREYVITWPQITWPPVGGVAAINECATLAEICARLEDIERDLSSPPGLPSPRPDCDD
jgi:hypothetical protein